MTALGIRPFGRTGFDVTSLCVGTSSWGRPRFGESLAECDERIAQISHLLAIGALPVNFVDTSNEYGEGRSEPLIGSELAASSATLVEPWSGSEGLVVQTKLDRDIDTGDFSADRMWRSVEESLSRLRLDRIQILYLHDPENIGFDAAMTDDGPVSALVAMKEQGIAQSIGISGGPVGMLQQFVETGLFDALVTHNRFTLVDRSAASLLNAATDRSMGITNAAPYGAGILTGDPRFSASYGYTPVSGHAKLPIGGHGTAHWRPAKLPTGGHEICPLPVLNPTA
jgi:D-threo-aldose 1-dehydrogenase